MDKNHILGLVNQAIELGVDDHRAKVLNHEETQVAAAQILNQEELLRRDAAIQAIPLVVRQQSGHGCNFGAIMRLRFDESAEHPNDMTGRWDVNPYPDARLLSGAARSVFDLCLEAGLQPYVVREYEFTIQKFFLYLCIQWSRS